MPKRTTTRVYTRSQGGETRFYGDFRAYADVGGGREALVPEGQSRGTTDRETAELIYAARLKELKEARRMKAAGVTPMTEERTLAEFAAEHLARKARDGEATARWLEDVERHLRAAVAFFGADTPLVAIKSKDCTRWVDHLRDRGNGRGGPLGDGSVRKYLNSLSNLYARAISDEHVSANPVGDMYSKPTEPKREAAFLSAREAALFLESARTFEPNVEGRAFAGVYPLVATFLLTGGRKSEVLGLEVDDVSFKLGKIYFRPNQWRRLKTRGSKRSVPLWPQLEAILRGYLLERERSGGLESLLFPAAQSESEKMLTDVRKIFDRIAVRAGLQKGHVRAHGLRHTYTAARIQTLDRGAPVSIYTVARELGHRSTSMIEERYGHLHDRAAAGGSEVVEYLLDSKRATRAHPEEASNGS